MGTKILKKLTLKTALGGKADMLAIAQKGREVGKDKDGKDIYIGASGKAVPALQIIGRVTSFTPGQSDLGSYLKLKGDFEATNLATGEVFADVGSAILPGFISDLIANAMSGGAEAVDFAVRIDLKYEETAATMYVFEAESLMPVQQAKSIASIRNNLMAKGVALAGPAPLAQLALVLPTDEPNDAPVEEPPQQPAKKQAKR